MATWVWLLYFDKDQPCDCPCMLYKEQKILHGPVDWSLRKKRKEMKS